MLVIKENPPIYFVEVKNYFAERQDIKRIGFNSKIDEKEISKYLNQFINGRPNIYGLFIKKPSENLWSLKYIGERKSKGIKQRLREHLIKCNENTGSQLERVTLALSKGYEIGIKLVTIIDYNGHEHARLLYESMLIKEFSEELEWNTQR